MSLREIPLRDRKAIGGRVPVTRAEWSGKHRDFKGISETCGRSMLGMDENGGAALWPVVIVDGSRIESETNTCLQCDHPSHVAQCSDPGGCWCDRFAG